MIDAGLTGRGVKIGIIDGGFLNADKRGSLNQHFQDKRVKYYKDFVTPTLAEYGGSRGQDDGHGTQVWEIIGGLNPEKNIQFGLATEADFYLARTDHAVYEKRQEEKYMIQAIHEMAAQGVRVINISLGYTNGYSRKSENYSPQMIDGKSTWITSSIDSILALHDVLLVVSAGNDGQTRWKTLSAPADSKNVLTVGASKLNVTEEMKYSSTGPTSLDYVKPDVVCFATSGTSFSAPMITGLLACMLQKDPNLSNAELIDILKKSSTLYPFPNNHTGFGIPDGSKILQLLDTQDIPEIEKIETKKSKVMLDSQGDSRIVLYHKMNGWQVIKKEVLKPKDRLKVKRFENVTTTTIVTDKSPSREIFWQD